MNTATEPIFPAAARARLSLCMIVKNEARCLARALRSAAPWVGELVVVDTGSTDETVAIAASFGARVLHVSWRDDFAAARNASLEAATLPWALVLDADEELVVTAPDELAQALMQEAVHGFNLPIESLTDDGGFSRTTVFRLFRRDLPGMRYRGLIHEQVVAVREGRVTTGALVGAGLRHDGYTPAVVQAQGKAARNVRLSRALVDQSPDDPYAWFALGLAHEGASPREALPAYEQALARLRAAGELPRETWVQALLQALVRHRASSRDVAQALALASEGLAIFPGAPDLHFMRGQLRFNGGDHSGAAADFQVCLAPEARRSALVETSGVLGYAAESALGHALLQQGQAEAAEAALLRAVAEAPPHFVPAHAALGSLYLQRGEWARALPHLEAFLAGAPHEREPRFKLGWCLYQLERYEQAEAALSPIADWPQAQELLGKVLLDSGAGGRALASLAACGLPSAGLAHGWALFVTGRPDAAASVWSEWLRAGAADWGTKDTLSRFLFLLQGGALPKGQPERPAEPLRDMDRWLRLLLRHQRFDEVEAAIGRGPRLGERLWLPLRKMWGITLVKEGFRDVGTALLLEAQAARQEDAEVYYWLGVSALEQQLREEAQSLWRTCLLLAPDHLQARQALSLLN